MSTVVLVWELGAGFGHVTRLKVLAETFSRRGHTVHLVAKDIKPLLQLYPQGATPNYHIHQAPLWPEKHLKLSREPATSAELLLSLGYYKPELLSGQLRIWRDLLNSFHPDVVVYDYAPTAVLASRRLNCLKISLHSPFSKPPCVSPMPAFDTTEKLSEANLALSDKKLVDVVNQSLQEQRLPVIRHAYQAFDTDLSFLLTIPELDLFAEQRRSDVYIGALDSASEGAVPTPRETRPHQTRIFAYLKPDYPALEAFLEVLAERNMTGRLFIPDCPADLLDRYTGSELDISLVPFNVEQAIGDCDLVICHGGHATVLHSILRGLSVLIIPLQQEQLMTARRVIDMGLGQGLGPVVRDREQILSRIDALLSVPQYKENARIISNKYRDLTQTSSLQAIVSAIEAAL